MLPAVLWIPLFPPEVQVASAFLPVIAPAPACHTSVVASWLPGKGLSELVAGHQKHLYIPANDIHVLYCHWVQLVIHFELSDLYNCHLCALLT